MSIYTGLIETETKKWLRDSLTAFMVIYPVMFGILGRWLVPWIEETTAFPLEPYYFIIISLLMLIVPHIYGALIAFSIIDDREDHIFMTIQVSPMSLFQFLFFRLVLVYVMTFAATIFIILFADLVEISLFSIILITFMSSFIAPAVTLLINSLAKNKIEGFAMMKAVVGVLLVFAIASLFFSDAREWFFAFTPGFWPAKAMSSVILPEKTLTLGFHGYFWPGLLYTGLFLALCYKLFAKRALK